jgi:hypothetical protein
MKPKILFVMPALRTPEYTEAAYNSIRENTHGIDYDILIGMDLDNADDRKYYEDHGIPYKVRQAWGHWSMANFAVFDSERRGLDYNFICLIHNDHIVGYDWLAGFRKYCEEHPDIEYYDNKLFSFSTTYGAVSSQPPVCFLPEFDYSKFLAVTKQFHDEGYTSSRPYYRTNWMEFLPWLWSFRAHKTAFEWLRPGDFGLRSAFQEKRNKFEAISFPFSGTFHFRNLATTLHHADYLRIQTTNEFFPELAADKDFMDLADYLLSTTTIFDDCPGYLIPRNIARQRGRYS